MEQAWNAFCPVAAGDEKLRIWYQVTFAMDSAPLYHILQAV
jgi:hypothetical protein